MALQPRTRRLIGWTLGATAVVGGVFVWRRARAKKRRPMPAGPPSPQEAAQMAIDELGIGTASTALTDKAYPLAYPDCPRQLDPDDPEHEDCVQKWLDLQALIEDLKEQPPEPKEPEEPKPGPRPVPDEPEEPEEPEPEERPPAEGDAAELRELMDSLSSSERAGVKRIVGASLVNQMQEAADSGSHADARAALDRVNRAIDDMGAIEGLKKYGELKDVLGEARLDRLTRLLGR